MADLATQIRRYVETVPVTGTGATALDAFRDACEQMYLRVQMAQVRAIVPTYGDTSAPIVLCVLSITYVVE